MSQAMTTPPHDLAAERALVGGALMWRDVCELLAEVPVAAFYAPRHAEVADAITALVARGDAVSMQTVRAEMVARGDATNGGLLLELAAEAATAGAARAMAAVVLDRWARRNALAHFLDGQRCAADVTKPLDRAVDAARNAAEQASLPTMKARPSMDVDEFLSIPDDAEEWVVPGVIERKDRTIVTGTEGAGKSTWLRCFAAQVAGGMHPFTHQPIPPKRVLVIDLENTGRQIRRSLGPMWWDMRRQQFPCNPANLRIEERGQGMDLLNSPADARWLRSVVEANRPDLLVTGPIYKLGGTSNKEDEAGKVARILDDVRVRHRCALLLEAHAPHGDAMGPGGRNLRPFGASLWLRWPEFGFGLRWCGKDDPDRFELAHWRGPREVRSWPKAVCRFRRPIPWGVRPGDEAR